MYLMFSLRYFQLQRLQELEDERSELVSQRRPVKSQPAFPDLSEDIPALFRSQVADLAVALNADDETRLNAAALLRPIFSAIRIYPLEGIGNVRIEVECHPHMPWLASSHKATL